MSRALPLHSRAAAVTALAAGVLAIGATAASAAPAGPAGADANAMAGKALSSPVIGLATTPAALITGLATGGMPGLPS